MINMLLSSHSKNMAYFSRFSNFLWIFPSAKASGNMLQRKLERREKYLPYFFRDWTITYIYRSLKINIFPHKIDVFLSSFILQLNQSYISRMFEWDLTIQHVSRDMCICVKEFISLCTMQVYEWFLVYFRSSLNLLLLHYVEELKI